MTLLERIDGPGPKKLLALEGHAARVLVTAEILAGLESALRRQTGAGADFVLADFFDHTAGTGFASVLAAGVALGMPADRLREIAYRLVSVGFERSALLQKLSSLYSHEPIAAFLKSLFGAETTLGSGDFRSLLTVVTQNATTSAAWPISNNPRSKYNDPSRPDSILRLPLWQVLRGATASPVYYQPQQGVLAERTVVMADAAGTPYANPALLLFLMTTLPQYRLGWPVGDANMMLLSISGGRAAVDHDDSPNILLASTQMLQGLIAATATEQDLLCRVLGQTRFGDPLDREIGDLIEAETPLPSRLFAYVRYAPDLSGRQLTELGLPQIQTEHLRSDSIASASEFQQIGRAWASRYISAKHFAGFAAEAPTAIASGTSAHESPLAIEQDAHYVSQDWWKWSVWIKGSSESLDEVEQVVYQLDPTFPDPVRVIRDRATSFKLSAEGWGVFPIKAVVVLRGGQKLRLIHQLELRYPDGTLTTR